jgi:hypothetical protein
VVICAALLELFASRRNQKAPEWTTTVKGLEQPMFLVPEFATIPYQRDRCLRESPDSLRIRNLFAPGNYLAFA